jgi:hypothetical protein
MGNAPGIRPSHSTPPTPLQKINENDQKFKKIKNFEISIYYVF